MKMATRFFVWPFFVYLCNTMRNTSEQLALTKDGLQHPVLNAFFAKHKTESLPHEPLFMQEQWPGMNSPREMQPVYDNQWLKLAIADKAMVLFIAKKFAAVLRACTSDEGMEYIVEQNRVYNDDNVCASHDLCDANVAMMEAIERCGLGVQRLDEPFVGENGDAMPYYELMLRAWNVAKKNDFFVSSK